MSESNQINDNKKSTSKKIVSAITIGASICTITGMSILGLITHIFNANNAVSTSSTIKDHKFSDEQELVNHYVPLCKMQIISMEEWTQCTQEELYYIRNGIYAYEGMKFNGNYYSVFEWYEEKIEQKDFEDGCLNYFQNKNITNIIKAEKIKKEESKRDWILMFQIFDIKQW